MPEKRTIPQSVFDSPDALRVAAKAHKEAKEILDNTHPNLLGEGNPNHPRYDGIFGYDRHEFLTKQYR